MALTLSYTVVHNITVTDADVMMLELCFTHNHKVQAIKYLRTVYGIGLKEAKDMVDTFWSLQTQKGAWMHWSTRYIDEQDCANKVTNRSNSLGQLLRDKLQGGN